MIILILVSRCLLAISQSIEFKVKPGCDDFPGNFQDEKTSEICSNQRFQGSICQANNSTTIYTCVCDFDQASPIFIVPICSWSIKTMEFTTASIRTALLVFYFRNPGFRITSKMEVS